MKIGYVPLLLLLSSVLLTGCVTRREYDALAQERNELAAQAESLGREVDSLRSDVSELQEYIREQVEENDQLRQELDEAKRETERQRRQIEEYIRDLEELKEKNRTGLSFPSAQQFQDTLPMWSGGNWRTGWDEALGGFLSGVGNPLGIVREADEGNGRATPRQ